MVWFIFIITFYQMFLGTQVRESIDLLIKEGVVQEDWTEKPVSLFISIAVFLACIGAFGCDFLHQRAKKQISAHSNCLCYSFHRIAFRSASCPCGHAGTCEDKSFVICHHSFRCALDVSS